MPTKKTQEEFIKEAKIKHGNKYDYSKINYKNTAEKIIIICPVHNEFTQTPRYHLTTQGCQKCSGAFINTYLFIKKANNIHNNKYDYSETEYKNSKTEITITCNNHGNFKQKPNSHLLGNGCGKCSGKFVDQKFFIEKANKVHNSKYDYSKTIYESCLKKIIIICPKHQDFTQTPSDHLSGYGCQKCALRYMSTNYFIEKATKIHGNRYDYSEVNYINSQTKVIIICKKHGKFEQSTGNHLYGYNCSKCSDCFMSTEYFIEKANKVHNNKYDYSKVNYINNEIKVTIMCAKHGEFMQASDKHLSGQGCSKCCLNQYSNMAINYLNFISAYYNIKIRHALNKGEFPIPETRYKADGFCKKSNTIYEFHGSMYHGAPSLYKSTDVSFMGKTYGELYANTIKKENKIKKLGYNLVVMWEHDWKKINKSIKLLQKTFKKKTKIN